MGLFDDIGSAGAGWGAFTTLGGSFLQNIANIGMQRETNAKNMELADKQMQFQRDETQKERDYETLMSNTAHQREMADYRAAGLNPNLGITGGGSSTPSVGAPSGTAAHIQAPQIALPDLMSMGISLKQLEQTDQKLAIDKANSAASISKTLSDTDLNKMRKVLMNKGMMKAELEGEGSEILRNIIRFIKDGARKNYQPKSPNSPSSGKKNWEVFMDSGAFDETPSHRMP